LSWVIANKNVSTAITGATSIQQLENNVKAVSAYKSIPQSAWDRIEEIFNTRPQ